MDRHAQQSAEQDQPACRHLHLADHSAIAAIEALYERYDKAGKHVQVMHLSGRSQALLQRAGVDVSVA